MARKFLIGQLACFGDCLYATTIAKQIKHDYPDSHVTWAVASKYRSILELNPYIDTIWEIPINNGDYYDIGWEKFEKQALLRKNNGEFDEVIFSQVIPLNLLHFHDTIRSTILGAYGRPITVSKEPVVRLSAQEIDNVKIFADKNNVQKYKHVVLFECEAGSKQSRLNIEHALNISRAVTAVNKDVCFIMSSSKKIKEINPRIIDASTLTYRENAELTKYCTLLVGCSSGITWLSTSDWAKKLPMVQILDKNSLSFAGVSYDLYINDLDNQRIIEILNFSEKNIVDCILLALRGDFLEAKKKYNEKYVPSMYLQYKIVSSYYVRNNKYLSALALAFEYKKLYRDLSLFLLFVYCFSGIIKSVLKQILGKRIRAWIKMYILKKRATTMMAQF